MLDNRSYVINIATIGIFWAYVIFIIIFVLKQQHYPPPEYCIFPLSHHIKCNDFHLKAADDRQHSNQRMPWELVNGTNIKNSQHLASCAWTHMSKLLSSLTSSAPGPWTNNEYVRGADRVYVEDNWPGFSSVFVNDESLFTRLGHKWPIHPESSKDNLNLDVFMCSFPWLGKDNSHL